MRGRPRSFDKDTAVSKFIEVFWKQGYDATSIDDLQMSIGVKRGSICSHWTATSRRLRQPVLMPLSGLRVRAPGSQHSCAVLASSLATIEGGAAYY